VPFSIDAAAPGSAGWRWLALAALLGIVAAGVYVVFPAPPTALDWQPALAAREPWRAWSAALVHLSGLHLAANLAGTALVGALGVVAAVPRRTVVAWLVAWPVTQLALLARPDLAHYAGLSGVLHAGVAVVAVHLVAAARGARRAIGFALLAALALKVASEAPWAVEVVRHPPGWDIAVVPFAHAAGLVAGVLASMLAEAAARWRRFTIDRT
jgi:rhomboid family GlyGly-CTERM serine protease